MSISWIALLYSLLSVVKALRGVKDDLGLSCYLDNFDSCFTSFSDGDNITVPDGDINIIAIFAESGKSDEDCISDVLHSAINLQYAIQETDRVNTNASMMDYAILCANGLPQEADDIFALLENIQNPYVILGATLPPIFTYAILDMTNDLHIPVYSLSPSNYDAPYLPFDSRYSIVSYSAPSHEAFVQTVVEVIDYFGWSWVSFLTIDDGFGQFFMRAVEMRFEQKDGVCIDDKMFIKKRLIADSFSDERLRIQTKIRNSTSSVFVVFVADSDYIDILNDIQATHPDLVWILATLDSVDQQLIKNDWTLHITPTKYSLSESLGDFLVDWCSRRSNCSSRDHQGIRRRADTLCSRVDNDMMEAKQEVERVDVYLAVRMIENHVICMSSRTTPNSSCSSTSSFDDVVAREVLPSTNESHPMNKFGGVLGSGSVLPWGFDIRAGRIASPRPEMDTSGGGDVLIGRYIENGLSSEMILIDDDLIVWPSRDGKVPESHCSPTCPSSHARFSLPGQPSCCFVCLYCEGSLNHSTDGSVRCEKCPQGYWFNITTGSCEPRYLDYLRWDSIPALVYIVICSFSILVNVVVLGVIAYHHTSPIVKAANRELSLLLLFGTIVELVAPMFHIGLPTVQQCMIHIGLQGPMITLIASVYLVKTKGVLSIFEARLPDLMHRHMFLQRHLQILAVFTLVLVEAVAATLYLLFAPPGVLYIDSHIPHITYVECNYGIVALPVQWLYNWIIVAIAFALAYRARHLPENFGEASLIAKSMGLSLLVWFISFMCFILSSGSMKAIFQNAILVASPWIFMGFLYFPKCYIILKHPHRNTVHEIRRMTLAHVQRNAEQVCGSSASRRRSSHDPSEQPYRDKINCRTAPSKDIRSCRNDDRIVLQIDIPEISRQGTDETGISPSSSRSSGKTMEDEPAILSLNDTSTVPPIELQTCNGCSTPHLANATISSSQRDAEATKPHTIGRGGHGNSEVPLRFDKGKSSVIHPTSCTEILDESAVPASNYVTPQETRTNTDACAMIISLANTSPQRLYTSNEIA
ncbi:extracellular calcium-sensing receptor-like [Lytechinus variegatus]|uniref:extracellular calcium-sensing receptor-like n=1 Tax=Lytechinus variegatus TaxID=7654 RepID=UPI001BB24DBB|nr:extracellular calcium-sensing receptor-like [Lytechinus variegatus]